MVFGCGFVVLQTSGDNLLYLAILRWAVISRDDI